MSPSQSSQPKGALLSPTSDRRVAPRAAAELPVRVRNGVVTSEARSVDLSTSGILLVRNGRSFGDTGEFHLTLDLVLPGEAESIRAVARPVWSQGPFQALKFVKMSATDRLTLAEHVDRYGR